MPVRLTPHPDESIFATDYLYANAAFGRPHLFVIESRKGDENSRDVHSSFLTSNQTSLLRDELTAFLGEPTATPPCHDPNAPLCAALAKQDDLITALREEAVISDQRIAAYQQETETLGQQKDYLFAGRAKIAAENEKLRQRVASLEKDAADLQKRRDHVDGLWTETIEDRHRQIRDIQAENARLKVDLMNARARTTATIIVKGY